MTPSRKAGLGLDQLQRRRWKAWHRWTTLVIAARALLAAAAVVGTTTPDGLITIIANELRRLFHRLDHRPGYGGPPTSSPRLSSDAGIHQGDNHPVRTASLYGALRRICCWRPEPVVLGSAARKVMLVAISLVVI